MSTTSTADYDTEYTPSRSDKYAFYDENYRPMWNRGISRKIGESGFVQQTLPTHRLSWSPYVVCPCFLLLGALFVGMGIGIKLFANNIQEVTIPYTDCESVEFPGQTCAEVIKRSEILNSKTANSKFVDASDIENCTCQIHFELTEQFNGTVYMYYTLTDFYQNHLDYYLSRDDNQLTGDLFKDDDDEVYIPRNPSSACKDFDYDDQKRIRFPCGLMANSMFTDVINLIYHRTEDSSNGFGGKQGVLNETVALRNTGIAWESDRNGKYKNPEDFDNAKHPKWLSFTKPIKWKKSLWELDPHNASNNGIQNEDFIVWMRAAAFPWFRKLYRIVDSDLLPSDKDEKGLPKGHYSLNIQYNYDVSSFNGEKQIILTTTSMVAVKNTFLAIVYLGTGAICIFLSIVLFIVYKLFAPSRQFLEKSFKLD